MAYRKGYYRKDGTYVSDSFDSRPSRKRKVSKGQSKGCLLTLMLIVIIGFITLLQ